MKRMLTGTAAILAVVIISFAIVQAQSAGALPIPGVDPSRDVAGAKLLPDPKTTHKVLFDMAAAPGYEVRALKREELAAMGSVALHELYFSSLGGDGDVFSNAGRLHFEVQRKLLSRCKRHGGVFERREAGDGDPNRIFRRA